jgi:hypothetical protein
MKKTGIEQSAALIIRRRLGPAPHANGFKTAALAGCPDLFESTGGSFIAIGKDVTAELRNRLPGDASCGPDERIIEIPRRTLVLARADIPETL